jgi:hypothetical protein
MAIESSIAESRKYILMRVTEPVTAEVARQIAVEGQAFADEVGIQPRLIDARGSRNVATVADNYDLAYKGLEELQIERATKAAVLVSPDDASHDFALIAIRNSGFNARLFTDEAAAIAWLEE